MPLPIELLALLAVLVAALVGWLTPAQALAGFGNPATLTVVAMFVLSAAVVRTGALAPVQSFLERHGGNSLSRQLLLLAAVVGPLSAVINNTAVVAMFIPVVERWCRRLGVAPARMLMPLSFMTVMAGVATLLGTSTNLVASSLSEQLGYGSFALLQFTPMALLTYGCGVLLLALLAPWLLPRGEAAERAQQLEAGYAIHDYLSELLVADSSPLVGQRLDDTLLQHTFDVRLLALIRDGERFSLPLGGQVLRGGDLLVVKGRGDRLLALRDQEGLELVPELGAPAPLDLELDAIAEVLVPAGSRLIGLSLREIRFSQRFTSTVLAIRRGEDLLRDRLGQVKLRLGDALLLQTPRATLPALQVSRDLLLLDGAVEQDDRRDRLPWALGVTAAMLVLTLLRSDLLAVWALLAVTVLVMGRVLTPQEVYASVRWDVVVLLAALLPLAQLFSGSGADRWLVSLLAEQVATWPPYALLTALYLTTALVTELVSNQAAVSLMLPLGLSISHGLGVHPFAAT
ncbi:SLC13 family permease [Vulcanococcus limneticus Candia 3F8]|uniref:SLC13 family permease n=1 Tax=Vulcanococcus limneticus TaxID=2170428 RepID=UPI0012FFBC1E|nr:SLC13 family permease [Vulcanococcus limneticus]MCP9791825.1 SLC13 family permease [Vulcanococcus limneticus MW73D5]MCP9893623.1 SLC13 family permease [Vulcanococcus limneticus Candia 3F8]MCP9897281.1 SLC13 family permease [Vulcanococcus limneticus Candia 3B3]